MKYFKTGILILLFISSGFAIHAQIKNDSLDHRIRPDSVRSGELYLHINNLNFLRNYEFFNKFQDGYTLFGSQLEPQLVYYPGTHLAVMAGTYLRKDFGSKGVYKASPLFSIKYQDQGFTMITGAIEATTNHHYIEPLYDVERRITDPVEYGTQFFINTRMLDVDAFVNWRRMIYKPSPDQEQILAGTSSAIKFDHGKTKFSVPLQLTVFHQGGQIDTTTKPLQTLLNTAAGIKIMLPRSGFLKEVFTENYIVGFKELSPTKVLPFSSGSGIYLNAGAESRAGTLIASYWRGNGFISVTGMPLFQSLSQQINNPGYTEKIRKLLFIRYAYQKELVPHFFLDFRVEPVFDLGGSTKKTNFYHSMFLVYRQDFRLLKTK